MTDSTLVAPDEVHRAAGTHRACSLEDTWRRIEPLLGSAGITRVAEITWLDVLGIPVWQAVRPTSFMISVSQGKGRTSLAAKISAVMESLERWHAEVIPVELRARAADLDLSYGPAGLDLFPGSLFHDRANVGWVAGHGLATGQPTWVPHQLLEMDFRPLHGYEPPLFKPTSNGLASGNTWDEATLHALLEVIERASICASADLPRRTLDLDSLADEGLCALVDRLRSGGDHVVIHDVTVLEGISTYSAKIHSAGLGLAFEGSGAHVDPAVAVSRALTEAAQSRATAISGSREDLGPDVYRVLGARLPPRHVPGTDDGLLVPARPSREVTSIGEALSAAIEATTAWVGSEPIVVRLDRGVDLPVVRVVVPDIPRDAAGTFEELDQMGSAR